MLAHGAGVTTSRLPTAVKWAQDGFVALDFNANGLPNAQPREFYAALQAGELKEYYLQGRESRDTMYLRGIFSGCSGPSTPSPLSPSGTVSASSRSAAARAAVRPSPPVDSIRA